MRANIIELIKAQPRQHSNAWYANRLGHFTGSQVGRLMKRGRGNDAEWSADAITYIKEVVAERLINPTILAVPELFEQYLDFTVASSKMMAWGTDNEPKALGAYTCITKQAITHCGALPNEQLDCFWDSPDGLLLDADGVVEVKCPAPKTHAEYLLNVKSGEGLLAINPVYYWQVISHMANTGANYCDWMSFCPFLKPALHIVRIERNDGVVEQLLERIAKADDMAKAMIADVHNSPNSIFL